MCLYLYKYLLILPIQSAFFFYLNKSPNYWSNIIIRFSSSNMGFMLKLIFKKIVLSFNDISIILQIEIINNT